MADHRSEHRSHHQGPPTSTSMTFVNSNNNKSSVSGRDNYTGSRGQSTPATQAPGSSQQTKSFAAVAMSGINNNVSPPAAERKNNSKMTESYDEVSLVNPEVHQGRRGRTDVSDSAASGNDGAISPNLTHVLVQAVGSQVTVSTSDGKIYEDGLLHSFNPKGDIMIQQPMELLPNGTRSALDFLGVNRSGIVALTLKNVDSLRKPTLTDHQTSTNSDRALPTDRDLSERTAVASRPKPLVRWCGDGPEEHTALSGPSHDSGWTVADMLKANEDLAARNPGWKKSDFDPDMSQYTVKLERQNTQEYQNMEREAARIASEIEKQAQSRAYAEKENVEDEEEAFSAVIRHPYRSQDARGGGGRYAGGYTNTRGGGSGGQRFEKHSGDRGENFHRPRDNNYGRQHSRENISRENWRSRENSEPIISVPGSTVAPSAPSPVLVAANVGASSPVVGRKASPPAKVASPQPTPQNVQSFNQDYRRDQRTLKNDREPNVRPTQKPASKPVESSQEQHPNRYHNQNHKRDSANMPSSDGRVYTSNASRDVRPPPAQPNVWNNKGQPRHFQPHSQQPAARAGNYQNQSGAGDTSSGTTPSNSSQRQQSRSEEPVEASQPSVVENKEKSNRTSPVRTNASLPTKPAAGNTKQLNPDAEEFVMPSKSSLTKTSTDSPSPSNFSEGSIDGAYQNQQSFVPHPHAVHMQYPIPVSSIPQGAPLMAFHNEQIYGYPQMAFANHPLNQFSGLPIMNHSQQLPHQNFPHINMQQANPAQIVPIQYPMMPPGPRNPVMISQSPTFIHASPPGQMDGSGQVFGPGYQSVPYRPCGPILYQPPVPPGGPYQPPGGHPGFLNMAGSGPIQQYPMNHNGLPILVPYIPQPNMMQQGVPNQMQGRMHSPHQHHPN